MTHEEQRMKNLENANGALAIQSLTLHTENKRLNGIIAEYKKNELNTALKIGQRVKKKSGYAFPGIIIGVAEKTTGKILYLVECTADGAQGMCHIFSFDNLEAV